MRYIVATLLIFSALSGPQSFADDIDMLVQGTAGKGASYLHILLDSSPSSSTTLCSYGPTGSCAPPFMTQETYENLYLGHQAGDAISRFEVFAAILTTMFENPDFGSIYVSLSVSDVGQGARVVAGYRRLQEETSGSTGAQSLIETLHLLSTPSVAVPTYTAAPENAFYDWYRYLNGELNSPQPFPLEGECSKLFSLAFTTQSAIKDNILAKTWAVSPSTAIDNPARLEESLSTIFSQVMRMNLASVASYMPIVGIGTDTVNSNVFVALSGPRATIRWPGNVKKFQFNSTEQSQSNGLGEIVDANNVPAFVAAGSDKGRIAFDTLSFWTDPASLPDNAGVDVPPGKDGRVVNRGGAGQQIPGATGTDGYVIGDRNDDGNARQLFVAPRTIANSSANTLVSFDADGFGTGSTAARLQSVLGAPTVAVAETLIRWGRGQDVDDEDGDGIVLEGRSWLLGGILHAKPLAINYGAVGAYSSNNPNVRIFFGSNDGAFHSIENTTATGDESGREVFAFYPDEGLANIALQRQNTLSSVIMQYGVDGPISAFTVDNNHDGNLNFEAPDNDEAYIYFGMRRGGHSYYALDVSNPNATPILKWKISRAAGDNTADDFGELGLSFSKPIVGKVKFEAEVLDVAIFAGGYHGGWDTGFNNRVGKDLNADDDVSGGVSHGNAVYIVNARTGALVWKATYGATTSSAATSTNTQFKHAQLVDSIPSAVAALKNMNGVIHRLYVGDTGGAIWRVDLPVAVGSANVDHRKENWFISKLAELGSDGAMTDRRFFHAPDIVRTRENAGTAFDGILISSGNRASPNDTGVTNYHFYIKDHLIVSGDDAVRVRPAIVISGSADKPSLPDRTACLVGGSDESGFNCINSMDNGWMIKLARPGEKGLSSPLVEGGKVYFTSYVPPTPQKCTVLPGEGFLYWVNLANGSAVKPGERMYPLGSGIPAAVGTLGDHLLTPLGGIGDLDRLGCEGKVCKRTSRTLHKIYWREPGIDEL